MSGGYFDYNQYRLFEFEVLSGLFGVAIDTDFTWLVILWQPFKLKKKK
jgi:hypothetical protein